MATKFSPRELAKASKPSHAPSLAFKPLLIGAVLENLMEQKKKTKEDIAAFMNVRKRTVNKWLKRAYLSVQQMMQLSDFFETNLLALYHPNVKDAPHPLDAVVAEQKAKIAQLTEELADKKDLIEENLRLEGKVAELEKMFDRLVKR